MRLKDIKMLSSMYYLLVSDVLHLGGEISKGVFHNFFFFLSFFLSFFLPSFFFFTSTSLLASSVRPVKIIQTVLQGIDGAVVCDRTEVINPETAFGANTPTFFYRATNSVLLYSITTVECRSHQGLFAYITLWERDDGIRVYIYIYRWINW